MNGFVPLAARDGSGEFNAYLVEPAQDPVAAIVVIQEVFGVNPNIVKVCHRWSDEGYLTIAPDLFWRLSPGVQLSREVPEELATALELMRRFDAQRGLDDISVVIEYARRRARKVGVLGFCLGGRLAYLAGVRGESDASVLFYGNIEDRMDSVPEHMFPFLAHFAGNDHVIAPQFVRLVRAALSHKGRVSIHEYPGVQHGFAGEFGPRRNEAAAQLANNRTREFFKRYLSES